MNDYIWEVTVTDKVIFFDRVPKPTDWEEKAIYQPSHELGGTYLGWREYEADHWYLRRDKRMPDNSGMTWYQWRTSQPKDNSGSKHPYDTGYAWEPTSYYKYDDKLYCLGAHFH